MATGAVTFGLVTLGALLVWTAFRGSRRNVRRQAAAAPLGVTGGVCVLGGIAVGVSGLGTPPAVVALVFTAVVVALGGLATVVQARRAV